MTSTDLCLASLQGGAILQAEVAGMPVILIKLRREG